MSAKLKRENERTNLYINEKLTPPIIYGLSDFPGAAANTHYAFTNIQNFARQGINIVTADSCLHLGWHKRLPFDSSAILAEIEAVMDATPEAKVLLRFHLNPPYWWLRDNPDECVVYRTKDGDKEGLDDGEQDRLIRHDGDLELRASFASKKWLTEASEKLEIFLKEVKGTRAGRGLIGIQLAYGMFGEWHAFGRSNPDVSKPMKEHFKSFLINKYKNVDALRAAWCDENADFDTAEYHPEPHFPLDRGRFRDPAKSMHVIDSQKSNQSATSEAILHFAKVLKRTSPELLCGAFYGYYLCTGDTGVIGGHLNVKDIQDSEYIDYVCGPFCYTENRKPEGVPMQRALLESHRLHGKLWLTEMDQFPVGVERMSGGTPENLGLNTALLRVNALQPIFGGHGFWYYDHRLVPTLRIVQEMGDVATDVSSIYRKRGWWSSREMMAEIGKIREFASDFIKRPYSSDADVLIVYDAEAKYYHSVIDPDRTEYRLFESVARCGVAYDCIYLGDLEICNTSKYKCIIFADCPNITAKMQSIIDRKCENATCIFLYGYGYSDETKLSCESISRAVGMSVGVTDARMVYSDLADDIPLDENVTPVFCVTEKGATPLAKYDNGEVAVAKYGNKVYASLIFLPTGIMKKIFLDAGVHLWCDSGESVIAASGCLLIKCKSGERTVSLPSGDKFSFTTEGYETRVYDVRTKERLL